MRRREPRPVTRRTKARKGFDMPKINVLDQDGRWNRAAEDEYLWWPRVQWIDPGVTSGVAVIWFDPKALLVDDKKTARVVLAYSEMFLHGGENGQARHFLQMHDKLDEEPGLAVGSESFVPRRLDMSDDFLSPVRIRSRIEYGMSLMRGEGASVARHGAGAVPLHIQSPSDALNAFTNVRLKALRMFTPGPDHINDAKRHALLWIRKLKGQGKGLEFFKEMHGYEEGWFDE